MNKTNSKKILFACMDGVLGHASRSVPLIRDLQQKGHEVILASAGQAFIFLKNYFPELIVLEKPAYGIRFSTKVSMSWMQLFQSRTFLKTIRGENKWLKEIYSHYQFEEVYSDNCYGVYHQSAISGSAERCVMGCV